MPKPIKLKVASPCQADWEAMEGDDAKRFCGSCKQDVYQLSNMSSREVEDLLESRKGLRTCVRFYQRADGTLLSSDCSVGKKQKRKKRVLKTFGAAAIGASALGASYAMGPSNAKSSTVEVEPHEQIMGGMEPFEVDIAPDPIPTPEHETVQGGLMMEPEPEPEPKLEMKMGDVAYVPHDIEGHGHTDSDSDSE